LTDTGGPLPTGTGDCPTVPSTLAAGAQYTCLYGIPYSTAGVVNTAASAQASNIEEDSSETSAVSVNVTACAGLTDRVVPNLIGLTSVAAQTAWTVAQFTGPLTPLAGGPATASAVAQSVQAYSCLPQNTAITISRTNTP
jgi:hypothetical protein